MGEKGGARLQPSSKSRSPAFRLEKGSDSGQQIVIPKFLVLHMPTGVIVIIIVGSRIASSWFLMRKKRWGQKKVLCICGRSATRFKEKGSPSAPAEILTIFFFFWHQSQVFASGGVRVSGDEVAMPQWLNSPGDQGRVNE